MKRVLLLVIDALTAPLLVKEMENGRYPNFQKLSDAGYLQEGISIFPSITHAALTSIITGEYPDKHGIIASHWYDFANDKVAYFSGSPGMMLQKGVGNFFREFLLDLNNDHLKALTLFQKLERNGHETACINFPLYRGDVPHKVNMPLLLKWIPNLPESTVVYGPKKLLLGDLILNPNELDIEASFTGAANWFGFHDKNTIDLVLQLAANDEFPDFTLAYFPQNDETSHAEGPVASHHQLDRLDEMLGDLIAAYGGLDSFLQQFMLIITGDHSQSETLADKAEQAINLEETLNGFQMAQAGQPWNDDSEIMACPNLRTAHLYFKDSFTPGKVQMVLDQLLAESRIDQLIYRASLTDSGQGYVVQTQNGRLHFWREEDGKAVDQFGNSWCWTGELAVVDGRLQESILTFPDYPNAFERIAGALDCTTSGPLWITAKLGHELIVPHIKPYVGGGSHASLHRLDSQPPLIVAGAPQNITLPKLPRITDIVPLCLACLETE
ncbi:MAG: hypothetical protein CL608_14295 [Anaerolineaceae bacterium]|nr:hypothetical protein [Anaerolineaceae bacterium]